MDSVKAWGPTGGGVSGCGARREQVSQKTARPIKNKVFITRPMGLSVMPELLQESLQISTPHHRQGMRAVPSSLVADRDQHVFSVLDARHQLLHQPQLLRIDLLVRRVDV